MTLVRVTCRRCIETIEVDAHETAVLQLCGEFLASVGCPRCGELVIRPIDGETALLFTMGGAVHSDFALEGS